jgi:biopolymer transport protein ExbD
MKFTRPVFQSLELNLAPLIDVVFILVIFFVVTSNFDRLQMLDISLPVLSGSQEPSLPVTNVSISLNAEGYYFLSNSCCDSDENLTKPIPYQSLSSIRSALVQKIEVGVISRKSVITLSADALTTHQQIVELLAVLQELGINEIRLTTKVVITE